MAKAATLRPNRYLLIAPCLLSLGDSRSNDQTSSYAACHDRPGGDAICKFPSARPGRTAGRGAGGAGEGSPSEGSPSEGTDKAGGKRPRQAGAGQAGAQTIGEAGSEASTAQSCAKGCATGSAQASDRAAACRNTAADGSGAPPGCTACKTHASGTAHSDAASRGTDETRSTKPDARAPANPRGAHPVASGSFDCARSYPSASDSGSFACSAAESCKSSAEWHATDAACRPR